MYPPQTSLIPIAVSLAKFIETRGLFSSLGWYPYWFLGVPFRYLSGPFLPIFLLFIKKIIPNTDYFEASIYLLFLSFLLSSGGWGLLAAKIAKSKLLGILAGIISLVLPFRYLTSIALGETSFIVSRNLLPIGLIFIWNYYNSKKYIDLFWSIIAVSFLLLINSGVLAILGVGMTALLSAKAFRKGKIGKISNLIKKSSVILGTAVVLATIWYTPSYWFTILANPSIAGASGFKVILRIFDFLRSSPPFFLAIAAVYFSGRIKKRFVVFLLIWLFTFSLLTIFRFLGDPDFWQDWIAWVYEIEIGLVFILAWILLKIVKWRGALGLYLTFIIILSLPYLLSLFVYQKLGKPKLLSDTIPPGVLSLEEVGKIAGQHRVFLSGSTVFWAGSLNNQIVQVRGGLEKASIHPFWGHGAYQLRIGQDPELAQYWLKALGINYVLIHTPESPEYYHDFRNISKWLKLGEIIGEKEGDILLRVADVYPAFSVNASVLNSWRSPQGGVDKEALGLYVKARRRGLDVVWKNENELLIKTEGLDPGELVVIAISYNSGWQAPQDYSLSKDVLGNILVKTKIGWKENLILHYQ